MCYCQTKDCRTLTERHNNDTMWYNNMLGSKQNCTWKVGLIPASQPNVKEIKTSYKSELIFRFIVDPPQHATSIEKYGSGASNNYWRTEDILVITNINNTHNGPTVQFPNNSSMNTTNTEILPLSRILINHEKKVHIFDGLHSASLFSIEKLCDNDWISILDKDNYFLDNKIIWKVHRNHTTGVWDIPISRPLRHRSHTIITRDKTEKNWSSIFMDAVLVPP